MFGNNPVSHRRAPEEGFLVKSIFYTIQGEGPFAGRPALFVRFAGCNLRCYFCDTDFSGGKHYTALELAAEINRELRAHRCRLIVFTGGEPMLQPLGSLIDGLHATNDEPSQPFHDIQIETDGVAWPIDLEDQHLEDVTIVCSPKTPRLNQRVIDNADHYKYILKSDEISPLDGLPLRSTQKQGEHAMIYRAGRSTNTIWVQACDEQDDDKNKMNLVNAARIAMHYGYRLSVQIHKLAGLE